MRRLLEGVVAKAVKWALPIWVQKPLVALWRAPVSSTVIQAALGKPGTQHIARFLAKASWPTVSRRTTSRLEMAMPKRAQQRHQPRHRGLSLMILGEHETAQLRPEMAVEALRQRRCHDLAVRRPPALASKVDDVRMQITNS